MSLEKYRDLIATCLMTHPVVEVEQGRSFPMSQSEANYAAICILDHTRIPWECSNCEGHEWTMEAVHVCGGNELTCMEQCPQPAQVDCTHPNAPTIGEKLTQEEGS